MIARVQQVLNQAAGFRQRTGRPFITITYAQSLDGSIAARPGERYRLSGPDSLRLTHQLRAAHDGILVGIGTVLADDPRLSVRLMPGRNPQPVVVDSRLRMPLQARLLENRKLPPWIATTTAAPTQAPGPYADLQARGARILSLPPDAAGQVSLPDLARLLAELGINSLMVEGGGRVITAFLAAGLADFILITIAPVLIGGVRAVGDLGSLLPHYPRLQRMEWEKMGEDLVVCGAVTWESA